MKHHLVFQTLRQSVSATSADWLGSESHALSLFILVLRTSSTRKNRRCNCKEANTTLERQSKEKPASLIAFAPLDQRMPAALYWCEHDRQCLPNIHSLLCSLLTELAFH